MPQGFRSIHHRLVNSVLQGKSPQVIGKAGRQINAVHKDGTKIPVLLALQRIECVGNGHVCVATTQLTGASMWYADRYHKKSFFVAAMLDLRNHNARAQEEEHDVQEEVCSLWRLSFFPRRVHEIAVQNVEVKNRYLGLKARVLAALVLVGLLQLTSLFIGHANLQSFVYVRSAIACALWVRETYAMDSHALQCVQGSKC